MPTSQGSAEQGVIRQPLNFNDGGHEAWARRLALLSEAAELMPEVPAALQAQRRSYQTDGFAWIVRLAHAGPGACLADDMGLGKTVQTLAPLLQRAALGPAPVIVPTSVCASWVAEAERCAPGLRVVMCGESVQAAAHGSTGAFDVVVASYALVQIDIEAFAARGPDTPCVTLRHLGAGRGASAEKRCHRARRGDRHAAGDIPPGADWQAGAEPAGRPVVDQESAQPRPARQ